MVERSEAYGKAVAAHVLDWSATDGGAVVENMGFPLEYELAKGKESGCRPASCASSKCRLLPDWGNNRTFAMPEGSTCTLPPPPEYSEDPNSPFFKEALEVYEAVKNLTDEQKMIARFWSDDPMLSPTPPATG